jgi:large subunit ribosomal protein L9
MAKEVLLMADVPDVGAEGDVVSVADGYARNFLFPRKMAALVTDGARRKLEKIRKDREKSLAQNLERAREMSGRLQKVSCTITVKTGGDGQLYGSVSGVDIAKALLEQGIDIDKHLLAMEKPIKELGVFNVPVKLHPDVETTVKVWVVEE